MGLALGLGFGVGWLKEMAKDGGPTWMGRRVEVARGLKRWAQGRSASLSSHVRSWVPHVPHVGGVAIEPKVKF